MIIFTFNEQDSLFCVVKQPVLACKRGCFTTRNSLFCDIASTASKRLHLAYFTQVDEHFKKVIKRKPNDFFFQARYQAVIEKREPITIVTPPTKIY